MICDMSLDIFIGINFDLYFPWTAVCYVCLTGWCNSSLDDHNGLIVYSSTELEYEKQSFNWTLLKPASLWYRLYCCVGLLWVNLSFVCLQLWWKRSGKGEETIAALWLVSLWICLPPIIFCQKENRILWWIFFDDA